MAAKTQGSLYEELVSITANYLGPAARRFIDHQIENHLDKSPQDVKREDLEPLIDWIRVAISLLTEDTTVTNEFIERLKRLAKPAETR